MMEQILVQIASYRDNELLPTIKDAIKQAEYPERLIFAVCYQEYIGAEYEELCEIPNCRVIQVNPEDSLGACWARNKTQSMWKGEAYTLQIDSHMRFAKNWDSLCIEMLNACGDKAILTAYCNPYDDGKPYAATHSYTLSADHFSDYGILLLIMSTPLKGVTKPVIGAFWSGHFSFSRGELIKDVPYDPNLYFHGEEISYAVRAWTAGYDIYYPNRTICFHQYDRGNDKRPLHWNENKIYYRMNMLSMQRVRRLLEMEPSTEDFGPYGLGNERTLKEYEQFAGVDFKKKKISAKAYAGWFEDEPLPLISKGTLRKNVLAVSAFKEIGRSAWKYFQRDTGLYLQWFTWLTQLKNLELVLYVDEELRLILPNGNYKTESFEQNADFWREFFEKEAAVMNDDKFRKLIMHRKHNPEHCHPEYSMMTHCKANFVRKASQQYPGYSHYIWIDFGCLRYPMNPDTVFDWSLFMDGKIHMQTLMDIKDLPVEPQELCTQSPDAIAAAIFVIPAELTAWYENVYRQELSYNHECNVADDEQNIMLRLAKKYPDKICVDLVNGWYEFLEIAVSRK